MVVLFPCDSDNGFCVEEGLALNFHSLWDQIKGSEEIMPNINLPCISNRTLCGVIDYFGRTFYPPNFGPTASFVKQDILIKTHSVKVREKEPMVIIEEFQTHLIDFKSVEQHQKSDQLAAIGGKVSKSPDRILRQRRKETFINKWRLVTVPIPSYVTKQLVTVERWNSVFIKYLADVYHFIRDFEKLTEVFEWLIDFIMEDIKFADLLRADDVKMLLDILQGINHHENKEIQTIFKTRKSQKKLKCAACSKVISLEVSDNKLVFTLGDGLKGVPSKVDSSSNLVAKEDSSNYQVANWGSMDLSSDDYENTGYDFQSLDQKVTSSTTGLDLSSNQSVDMRSLHSTVSCTSEDEDNLDALIGTQEEAKSDEVVVETENTRPPSGSPLQDHFNYSGKCNIVNRVGKGNRSGRSEQDKVIVKKVTSRQNSMKDASLATELDISSNEYGNTGVSIDSGNTGRKDDQLRMKKAGSSFFVGIIKKSFKDKSRSSQNMEQERINVAVNGHAIPDRLVKKAEKVAGPIQPGQYWYDSRAGFWGLIGGPCLGIIPPNIEEFGYPIPEDCVGGNTGVYVNGRELHQKDLILLGNRGLPTERDRSYIIEMSGRVLDEDFGEELDSLGKLAPTVEKSKRGFGMKPLRTPV